MCGIFFSLINQPNIDFKNEDIDFELLKKRGPDNFDLKFFNINDNLKLLFGSSVLSLRGGKNRQVTKQPLLDSNTGNVLLWNGEIFSSNMVNVNDDENDGENLFFKLNESNGDEKSIFKIFESIHGPYGFVFYNAKTGCVYFGRDRLGRRSLLISVNNHNLTLSSVKIKLKKDSLLNINEFEELKANGIYKIDINNLPILSLNLFEWKRLNEKNIKNINDCNLRYFDKVILSNDLYLFDSISSFNEKLDQENDNFEKIVDKFYSKLKESVMRRVKNIPNYCKNCSQKNIKSYETIKFNLDDSLDNFKCNHAKLAILFSGGVDSTVLAALADLCLPQDEEIDLLNIAFEKQKNTGHIKKKTKDEDEENEDESNFNSEYCKDEFLVPDRISGLESLKELNKNRKWNFVEINVTLNELRQQREDLIKNLLYPHATVLDDSIGCALWFASRGLGFIKNNEHAKIPYTSNAEVLLLGMGADEQLAGYARHRTRYEKEGVLSLCNELKMEMKRISERNLGRDDRIISDHGKESRLPFLDEELISFLNELGIHEKCNMKLPKGRGEKYLLRYLASSRLGLNFASQLPKRAIQFGSRVAKIENIKEKGSDLCNRIANNLTN